MVIVEVSMCRLRKNEGVTTVEKQVEFLGQYDVDHRCRVSDC